MAIFCQMLPFLEQTHLPPVQHVAFIMITGMDQSIKFSSKARSLSNSAFFAMLPILLEAQQTSRSIQCVLEMGFQRSNLVYLMDRTMMNTSFGLVEAPKRFVIKYDVSLEWQNLTEYRYLIFLGNSIVIVVFGSIHQLAC